MHAYDKMILQEVEYFLELLAMLRRVRCQREYVSKWAESASLKGNLDVGPASAVVSCNAAGGSN